MPPLFFHIGTALNLPLRISTQHFFYVLLILFLSCSEQRKKDSTTSVFRVAIPVNPVSLDPQQIWDAVSHKVASQILEGLVTFSPDSLKLLPLIAESWEISDDGRTFIFKIRRGIRFHDDPCFPGGKGRELTAEDVRYSWSRILSSENGPPSVWRAMKDLEGYNPELRKKRKVSGLKTVSEYQLEVRFIRANVNFPMTTFLNFAYVVPKEAVEYYGENFRYHPVGTGPFRFESWERNKQIVLTKNSHYWQTDKKRRRLPYLDKLVFRIQSNLLINWAEFKAGRLDAVTIPITVLRNLFKNGVVDENVLEEKGFKISRQPISFRSRFIEFEFPTDTLLMSHEIILNNKYFRQALNYAVNREKIVNRFFPGGQAFPAKSRLPPLYPRHGVTYEGYGYDPERAKLLLKKAGYPNGEGLPELFLRVPTPDRNLGIAEQITSDWERIGIHVQLLLYPEYMEPSEEDMRLSNMRIAGWNADFPDLSNFMFGIYRSRIFQGDAKEYCRFLENQIATELDDSTRIALCYQLDEFATEMAYEIFLYHPTPPIVAVRQNIEGFVISPIGNALLSGIRLTK
ncbi:MAG: ABC transporter substrate-binding protein [Fidelibacterota bacterium]